MEITDGDPADVEEYVDMLAARLPTAPRADVAFVWSHPDECPDLVTLVARDDDRIAAAGAELLAKPPPRDAVAATVDRFSWDTNAALLREHLAWLVEQYRGK